MPSGSRFSSGYPAVVLWSLVATLCVSLFFFLLPDIDIAFSALFWNPDSGFILTDQYLVSLASRYNYLITLAYLLLCFLSPCLWWFWRTGLQPKKALYLFLSLLLGPGVLVNGLLKSHLGRARPEDVEAFGGSHIFTRVWELSDQCYTNCSFVSGHAAGTFAWYALALLALPNVRRCVGWCLCVTVFGLGAGFGRVLEGRHFLSDIVLAGLLVWLVALLCYYPLWRQQQKHMTSPAPV